MSDDHPRTTLSVMVVDDTPQMLELMAEIIVAMCDATVIARYVSAQQVRRHWPWTDVDVVVTDLRMPSEDDGIRLLSWMHQSHPTIPVVVVTAADPTTTLRDYPELEALAEHVLFKPFAPADLCYAIEEAANGG